MLPKLLSYLLPLLLLLPFTLASLYDYTETKSVDPLANPKIHPGNPICDSKNIPTNPKGPRPSFTAAETLKTACQAAIDDAKKGPVYEVYTYYVADPSQPINRGNEKCVITPAYAGKAGDGGKLSVADIFACVDVVLGSCLLDGNVGGHVSVKEDMRWTVSVHLG